MAEFKMTWKDQEAQLPDRRLKVFGMYWRIDKGMQPTAPYAKRLSKHLPFFEDIAEANWSTDIQTPTFGDIYGHHLATDDNYLKALGTDFVSVTLPLYVRDLAGRIVYLPMAYEQCNPSLWSLPNAVSFPEGVVSIDEETFPQADLLENVFMTSFRPLDMSVKNLQFVAADELTMFSAFYKKPQLYPYKMRLDTFFVDGWKIPQTQMLYAKPSVEREAEQQAQEFYAKWQGSKAQGYEAFVEGLGEETVKEYFEKGITLIPTFEACNGYNKVSANFDLEDYWPGRAVVDLHNIVESRVSDAPEGTILEVVRPGIMMAHRIEPAQVIVSDGSNYQSPHGQSKPKFPNLKYPHQRTTNSWGAVWVPTEPQHFESPAIWGWEEKTGHFVQLKGPIWDPLHYYYESVDRVLDAYKGDYLEGSVGLYQVPEDMKLKFYPVKEMRHYDVVEVVAYTSKKVHFDTSIFKVETDKVIAPVGYHPLPENMDFELSPYWFPYLHPLRRQNEEAPIYMVDRLVSVAEPHVTSAEYLAHIDLEGAAPWLAKRDLYMEATGDINIDYPQLKFYQDMGVLNDTFDSSYIFVEPLEFPEFIKISEVYKELKDFDKLEAISSGLYKDLLEMRQSGLKLQKERINLFKNNFAKYVEPFWFVNVESSYSKVEEVKEEKKVRAPNVALMGVGEL